MSTQTTPDDAMDAALPAISPGAVLKAMEDPAVFAETARGDLYVQMGTMRKLLASPSFPVALRADYMKFLAKLGRVEQPDPGQPLANGGFSVVINIPPIGSEANKVVTIEGAEPREIADS